MADQPFFRGAMKPEPFSISKYFPILLLLVFLSFFAHLGDPPLFDADEGAYSEVTREMLAANNFTSPLLNGKPFFHKPPLFFWAQAASIKFLGLSESALRLPSAIAAILWAASVFLFTRRFYGTRSAWHATLFMTSSLLVTITGRTASPEAMFCLFMTLAVFNIYRFHCDGNRRHIYWSFMFAALGVLVKGTAALLIPVITGAAFFSLRKKLPALLKLLANPVGLLVFGLIVIPWYLAEFLMHGSKAFLQELLPFQQAGGPPLSFIGGTLPLYLYPALLLFFLLPYPGLFIRALTQSRKLFGNELQQFMIVWFLTAFLCGPFFYPRSPFTMVYGLPPLFIIMSQVADLPRRLFSVFIWPLLLIALLCLAPDVAPRLMDSAGSSQSGEYAAATLQYFDAFYRLTLGAILFLLTSLPFVRAAASHTKFAILGLLFVSLVHFLVLPILGNIVQQPVKSAALLARKEGLRVVTWQMQPPSFNLYAEMLTEQRRPGRGEVVLTKKANLQDETAYDTLFEKHGIILARIH